MDRRLTAGAVDVRDDGRMRTGTERRRPPVEDAAGRQRLTGLQRAAVDGELHDAADEVMGGDLTAALKDGF